MICPISSNCMRLMKKRRLNEFMMSPSALRLESRCADDDNRSSRSAVRFHETTRQSSRSVCNCSCNRSFRLSCCPDSWCRECLTQTWWLRKMNSLSCCCADMNCASCSGSRISTVTYTNEMRLLTSGSARMKSQRAMHLQPMTVNHISLASWHSTSACLIMVMLMDMKPEMGGDDGGVRWVRCDFLACHVATLDFRATAISDFRFGRRSCLTSDHHGADGDDDAYPPSSPVLARRVHRCRPFSVSAFSSECRLFASRVGD